MKLTIDWISVFGIQGKHITFDTLLMYLLISMSFVKNEMNLFMK
jgi:hypothetical protein